ncbi:uncharacterized protein LOC108090826 [Drosophila ficusphila]|uniref:uncharacterized protein LOC108090826 n=1 Tax=Drosophila ficusphila TaxID=30025 RepID=UPI0007E75BC4|nr:uncharacterized protein LOC108090826 [Drosophila ficusphila]
MSRFHTLMGALFDPFIFVLRLIANMSSPIYEHYRCGPTSRPLPTASLWTPSKGHQEPAAKPSEVSEDLRIPPIQPDPMDPLATMMSFKLMAMDVVSQMQTALHKCVNAQSPPCAKMAGLELDALRRCVPSSCYFFIDLHPRHGFKEAADEFPTSQVSSDKNNNSGSSGGSPAKGSLQRQRSISECSEDSFICFEDDTEGENENDIEEDDNEDDDDDDDSSVQFVCGEDEDYEEPKAYECSHDSTTTAKKVRFNMKPEVHVMLAWDYAYRAARKSEWQVMARDRARFQQRIKRISPILNAVLTPIHRESVYHARFLPEEEPVSNLK